ncbi:MAG: hypothetical protein JO100_07965 [Pseudonocardia sp.]|nr:hypothetical protein [Pseudonocardia sp.]
MNTLTDPTVLEHDITSLYLPGLVDNSTRSQLADLEALLICDRLHPGLLREHAGALLGVADRGGTIVVLGEVEAHTWLSDVDFSPRPTNFWWWLTGESPGIRRHNADHSIWHYVGPEDVVWHYHGILLPARDVTPLVSTDDGGLVLYEDRSSTAGRLLVSTMDPVHHHGSNFMPAATRFLYGLLRWLAADPE